jgi:predicted metalloprotease with PDZ domain
MFGAVPFGRYLFLDGFRAANGGIAHANSALITTSPRQQPDDLVWLAAAGREYCQAFLGKRLRPIELGPFDYENPPTTSGLWLVEGFAVYLTDLACARCGAATQDQWLSAVSASVRGLQSSPGRRVQTLAESSTTVWTSSLSGIGGDPRSTVSYLVKGPVVAFLLDARLRAATNGRHGLVELMQQAYARWSGESGFQPEEFEALAAEVAGSSLRPFFARAVYSTEELDYREVLRWFGLRFRPVAEGAPASERWTLDLLPEATPEQTAHLQALLAPTAPAQLRPDPAPAGR